MWLSFIRLMIVVNLTSSHVSFITCAFQDQNARSKWFQKTGSCKLECCMITCEVWQVSGSIPKYLKLQKYLLKILQLGQWNVCIHMTVANSFYMFRSARGFYHGELRLLLSSEPKFKFLSLGPMWQALQEVVGCMRESHVAVFTFAFPAMHILNWVTHKHKRNTTASHTHKSVQSFNPILPKSCKIKTWKPKCHMKIPIT